MKNGIDRPRIVAIGGGSGISHILAGFRNHNVHLSAIVTMFDSGGSSGHLRSEFGYPPFGDLRQCLLALSNGHEDTYAMRKALEFRFGRESSLNGHSVGNLLLAALTSLSDDVEWAIKEVSNILQVKGDVIPVTLDKADLCAELEDGRVLSGESTIDLRGASLPPIKRIFLNRRVAVNPTAVAAIENADAVLLGPGDLFTSILPNLLVDGMPEALARSRASITYLCNLMTKHGETDGFAASDFVEKMLTYLDPVSIDWAVVNSQMPSESMLKMYAAESAFPVEADMDKVESLAKGVILAPLASDEPPLRHDTEKVVEVILEVIKVGKLSKFSEDRPPVVQAPPTV